MFQTCGDDCRFLIFFFFSMIIMIPPCLSSAGGSGRGTNWGLGCLLWRKCAGEPRLMVPARDRTKCHTGSFCSGQVRGSTRELNSLDVDSDATEVQPV